MEFEDVKAEIVAAQLAATPKGVLVESVLKGTADLLSAHDIIRALGISSAEFEKLVNLPNHYLNAEGSGAALHNAVNFLNPHIELISRDLEKQNDFPKPDLYILGKARWKKSTFKAWLEKQCV